MPFLAHLLAAPPHPSPPPIKQKFPAIRSSINQVRSTESLFYLYLYLFPRIVGTKYHKLDGFNNRNVFPPSSGSQKSGIRCQRDWIFPGAGRENLFPASLLASVLYWQSVEFLGLSLHRPILSLHVAFSLCLCPCPHFLYL